MLRATRQLLVEEGYQGTTIVAIARRAGVGAPTIYRRWPRREAIIEDAVFGEAEATAIPASSGNLREDMRGWTRAFLQQFADPVTRAAVPGLLLAYQREEVLYEQLVNRSELDVRLLFRELLDGYLSDMADDERTARVDAIFDLMVSATAIHALTKGSGDQESFCASIADALTALAHSSWLPPPANAE